MIYGGGGNAWYAVVYANDELRKYSTITLLLLVQFLKNILFEYSQIHFPKLRYILLNQYISIKRFEYSLLIYCQGMIQNPFLTAQSTQIKSVISVPIKDFIHHYPRALFNDIPRVGAHFYDIPGSGRTFTTYPGRGAV